MTELADELRAAFLAGWDSARATDDDADERAFDEWYKHQLDLLPIDALNLEVRTYNAFRRNHIRTVGQARVSLAMTDSGSDIPWALDIRNIGWTSVERARAALEKFDRDGPQW